MEKNNTSYVILKGKQYYSFRKNNEFLKLNEIQNSYCLLRRENEEYKITNNFLTLGETQLYFFAAYITDRCKRGFFCDILSQFISQYLYLQ